MPTVISTLLKHLLSPHLFLARETLRAETSSESPDEVLPRNQFSDTTPFIHRDSEVATQS